MGIYTRVECDFEDKKTIERKYSKRIKNTNNNQTQTRTSTRQECVVQDVAKLNVCAADTFRM